MMLPEVVGKMLTYLKFNGSELSVNWFMGFQEKKEKKRKTS